MFKNTKYPNRIKMARNKWFYRRSEVVEMLRTYGSLMFDQGRLLAIAEANVYALAEAVGAKEYKNTREYQARVQDSQRESSREFREKVPQEMGFELGYRPGL